MIEALSYLVTLGIYLTDSTSVQRVGNILNTQNVQWVALLRLPARPNTGLKANDYSRKCLDFLTRPTIRTNAKHNL
jgi:hypothetical protein